MQEKQVEYEMRKSAMTPTQRIESQRLKFHRPIPKLSRATGRFAAAYFARKDEDTSAEAPPSRPATASSVASRQSEWRVRRRQQVDAQIATFGNVEEEGEQTQIDGERETAERPQTAPIGGDGETNTKANTNADTGTEPRGSSNQAAPDLKHDNGDSGDLSTHHNNGTEASSSDDHDQVSMSMSPHVVEEGHEEEFEEPEERLDTPSSVYAEGELATAASIFFGKRYHQLEAAAVSRRWKANPAQFLEIEDPDRPRKLLRRHRELHNNELARDWSKVRVGGWVFVGC